LQARCVEVDGVKEEVECSTSTAQIGSPPPMIVLRTEVEVAEEDGGFSTRDY